MAHSVYGISDTTTQNFVIDAGALYLNFGETGERLLGATRGGSTFSIEQDVKVIEIDGARGNMKGARRVITSNAGIKCALLEMNTANLLMAIPGSTATNYTDTTDVPTPTAPTHDEIRRTRNISDLDYITNLALVGRVSGTNENAIFIIYNALSDDKLEMKLEDKNELVLELTFSAHYDPTDAMTEPWAIIYPKAPVA